MEGSMSEASHLGLWSGIFMIKKLVSRLRSESFLSRPKRPESHPTFHFLKYIWFSRKKNEMTEKKHAAFSCLCWLLLWLWWNNCTRNAIGWLGKPHERCIIARKTELSIKKTVCFVVLQRRLFSSETGRVESGVGQALRRQDYRQNGVKRQRRFTGKRNQSPPKVGLNFATKT